MEELALQYHVPREPVWHCCSCCVASTSAWEQALLWDTHPIDFNKTSLCSLGKRLGHWLLKGLLTVVSVFLWRGHAAFGCGEADHTLLCFPFSAGCIDRLHQLWCHCCVLLCHSRWRLCCQTHSKCFQENMGPAVLLLEEKRWCVHTPHQTASSSVNTHQMLSAGLNYKI